MTVIVEEDQTNPSVHSPGAFIRQYHYSNTLKFLLLCFIWEDFSVLQMQIILHMRDIFKFKLNILREEGYSECTKLVCLKDIGILT